MQFTRRKKAQYESCEAEIISTPFNGHFPVYIPPHFRRECLGTIGSFTAQVPLSASHVTSLKENMKQKS